MTCLARALRDEEKAEAEPRVLESTGCRRDVRMERRELHPAVR